MTMTESATGAPPLPSISVPPSMARAASCGPCAETIDTASNTPSSARKTNRFTRTSGMRRDYRRSASTDLPGPEGLAPAHLPGPKGPGLHYRWTDSWRDLFLRWDRVAMSRPKRLAGFSYVGLHRYFLTFRTLNSARMFERA